MPKAQRATADLVVISSALERWARLIPDYEGHRILFTGLMAQQSSLDLVGALFASDGKEVTATERLTIDFRELEPLLVNHEWAALRFCQDKITEAVGRLKLEIEELKKP